MNDTKIVFSDEQSKHSKRISRLSAHKRRTIDLLRYANTVKTSLTSSQKARYSDCHSYLEFRNYFTLDKVILQHAIHCDIHLLCPLCAIRRASKKVLTYGEKVAELVRNNPSLRLFYVVVTVKNDENLLRAYEHLINAQRTLTRRRREAQSYEKTGNKKHISATNSVFAQVEAGAYSIEVKKGKNSGEWHPHTNFVLLSEKAIDRAELQKEWQSLTNDSFIVYCKEITQGEATKDALVEIFKYAMKFSEMEEADTVFAWETLRGRRLTGSFGAFRGLDIDDDEADKYEGVEYEEVFYTFLNHKNYKRTYRTIHE